MRTTTLGTCTKLLLVLTVVTLLAGMASATLSGAIFTTTSTGTTVNGNIYNAKTDVYLNGGPQNTKDPGLPPGTYYFQVTDPSGAILLSADDISCRQVVVDSTGRIVGVPTGTAPSNCTSTTPAGAFHPPGTTDPSNGQTPVELCPATPSPRTDNLGGGAFFDANNWCDNTPNPGGEYKAWLTPVGNYSLDGSKCSTPSRVSFGFCDADSKTDNFKVKKANVAYITVCKFNDLDGNGTQESGEPLIPFWPINAMGVDTLTGPLGTVNGETDATGCVSFSVSTFPNSDNTDTATLTENVLPGWVETAPLPGTYDASGNPATSGPTSVTGFTETITVKAGDNITAPNFGNTCVNFDPNTGCGGNTIQLNVTKDANPSLTRTFTWAITKTVDTNQINTHGNDATFNYTVNVTHDAGTDSGWKVTGTIKVSNPSLVDVTGVNVSDAVDDGGSCSVTGGTNITVPASSEVDVPYMCTYTSLPAKGTNTATASWDSTSATGTASIDFSGAAVTVVDGSVSVTDTFGGSLGTVSYTDASPTTFTYSHTFSGDPAGTCTPHTNTATFTTNTTGTTGSASQTVKDCQGVDLTVSKTATPSFTRTYNWKIAKSVDKTLVEQIGGTVTFNYTVTASETGFTDSAWAVSGTITITNPNDWEAITGNVGDAINNGGSCTVTPATVTVPASSSVNASYTCTYASAPSPAAFTNTATATWDNVAFSTPKGSASGSATGAFGSPTTLVNQTIHVTDSFAGALGTCTATDSAPFAVCTFKYSRTITVKAGCFKYDNTATITETGQTASAEVEVCGPAATGALTMGFWQNKNGQGIISGGGSTGGVCNSGTWLRQFNPFQDLSSTASCSKVASYVATVIGAATCGGSTCNAMLKAQMLATALDVYFSDPALGGNKIGAFNGKGSSQTPIGAQKIDLTHICAMIDGSSGSTCSGTFENCSSVFGGATCLTVLQMLQYENNVSNAGGTTWYGQVKSKQVLAKDAFDSINNQVAFNCP